ncbi:hypothetical protein CQW23_21657 [Capsicum baccatum]|uniref:Zinc finger PMZ-type domain-containing protein n=1 Tax=Capsicum baccatum TaxID=33114 RepID=A0A2G2VYL8_CAPBA|nr:hypothetical protein CQW23_21657 [Capsicum baccatum]
MDLKDNSMELKDLILSEEAGEEYGLGAQTNHTFSNETNLQVNQIFSNKKELKLSLDVAAMRNSIDYVMLKSRGKFLKVNHHHREYLYLFYTVAKAYSPEEFSNHFVEFKHYCPEVAFFLEHELGFEKWSRVHFPGNRFDVITKNFTESMNAILIAKREYPVASIFNSIAKRFGEIFREARAYVLKYEDNKFVPTTKKILRDNMSEGDFFYMENVSRDERKFTVFGSGCMTKVDLLERSCSYRKFDQVKIPCDHAMTALRLNHGDDYGLRVYDYSSLVYKVEEYLLAYSESINVVPLESE